MACGLERAVEFVNGLRFEPEDVDYLASLSGGDGGPLFERPFLDHLAALELSCDIDAIPEGPPSRSGRSERGW